jgi:hypothetical protein
MNLTNEEGETPYSPSTNILIEKYEQDQQDIHIQTITEKEFPFSLDQIPTIVSSKSGTDFLEIKSSQGTEYYAGETIYLFIKYQTSRKENPFITFRFQKRTVAEYFEANITYVDSTLKLTESPSFLSFQIPVKTSYGPMEYIYSHEYFCKSKYEIEYHVPLKRKSTIMNLFQKKLTGKIPIKIFPTPLLELQNEGKFSYSNKDPEYYNSKFNVFFNKKHFALGEDGLVKIEFSGNFYEVNIFLTQKANFDIIGVPVNKKQSRYRFTKEVDPKTDTNLLLGNYRLNKGEMLFSKVLKFKIPNDLIPSNQIFEDFGMEYNVNIIAIKDDYSYKSSHPRNCAKIFFKTFSDYFGGPIASHPIVISSPEMNKERKILNLNEGVKEIRIYHDELDTNASTDFLGGLNLLGNMNFM